MTKASKAGFTAMAFMTRRFCTGPAIEGDLAINAKYFFTVFAVEVLFAVRTIPIATSLAVLRVFDALVAESLLAIVATIRSILFSPALFVTCQWRLAADAVHKITAITAVMVLALDANLHLFTTILFFTSRKQTCPTVLHCSIFDTKIAVARRTHIAKIHDWPRGIILVVVKCTPASRACRSIEKSILQAVWAFWLFA